jgi:hypothetical protein
VYNRRPMLRRFLSLSAVTMGLLAQSTIAHADPAAAEALFREGRALLERGQLEPACEKLQASNELDPSAGTLLNLAACRLKQGKTATAWAYFVAAERLANQQSRSDQAAEAKRRASELEPRLSTLTLNVRSAAPGLEVRRAGQIVQPGSFGSPVPVDPGAMVIEASAPGYEMTRLDVSVSASAEHRVIEIPELKKLSAATTEPAAAERAETPLVASRPAASSRTVLPWVIGGVGGATVVAGSVLGLLALSSDSRGTKACRDKLEPECTDLERARNQQALGASIGIGVGLVGIGVAAIWLLTGNSGRSQSAFTYHGEVTPKSALLQMKASF